MLTGTFQHSPAPAEVASARIETIARYGGVEIDIWCLGSDTAKVDYAAFWAPWIPALKKFLANTDDAMASKKTDDRHSSNRAVPARQEVVAFYGQDDRRGPEQPPSPAFWLDFPVGQRYLLLIWLS